MSLPDSPIADKKIITNDLRASLLNYIRKRAGVEVAEDLLQDVFVKLIKANNAGQAPDNVVGWLYAVARTTVVDYFRRHNINTELLDDNFADNHSEDEDLQQELSRCLEPFVNQLPEKYRDTLIATDFEGKTMQLVANELGLSVSAIKSRASRARAMLKTNLLNCCYIEIARDRIIDYYPKAATNVCCN